MTAPALGDGLHVKPWVSVPFPGTVVGELERVLVAAIVQPSNGLKASADVSHLVPRFLVIAVCPATGFNRCATTPDTFSVTIIAMVMIAIAGEIVIMVSSDHRRGHHHDRGVHR